MSTATEKFLRVTKYDIEKFLNDYINFSNTYYSRIVNYYNGGDIDMDSFRELDRLKSETIVIDSLFEYYYNWFNQTDCWELIDAYSDITVKLSTVDNLGKWLRSARTNRYNTHTTIDYIQKQGETLESIAIKAGGDDQDINWIDLAISNDLNEEKYTSAGGVMMRIKLNNGYNFELTNIVDYFTNDNLYGKDFQNKITFQDNDIIALFGPDSLMQTVDNILMTFKGSIPEFKEDGIDHDLIGSNVSVFNYPVQFRNIMSMLQKDDRFKSIELIDLGRQDDIMYMKIQITTKIGELIKREVNL